MWSFKNDNSLKIIFLLNPDFSHTYEQFSDLILPVVKTDISYISELLGMIYRVNWSNA